MVNNIGCLLAPVADFSIIQIIGLVGVEIHRSRRNEGSIQFVDPG